MDSGRLSLSGSRPPRWPRTKGAQLFSHPPRPVSREGERDTDRGGRAGGEKGSSSGRAGDQILPAAAAAASLLEREEREAAAIDGGGGERQREKKGGGWWWLGSARARRGGGGSRCLAWPGLRCSANPTGFYFIRACLCPSPRAPSMTGGVRTSARGARSQVPRGRPMPDATLSEVGTLPLCGSLSPYPFSKRKKNRRPQSRTHGWLCGVQRGAKTRWFFNESLLFILFEQNESNSNLVFGQTSTAWPALRATPRREASVRRRVNRVPPAARRRPSPPF